MMLGLKLLTKDGKSVNSLYGRVKYPADGSWVDVPGNGAYVARTGGLTSGGYGPVLAVLECDINTRKATSAPDGVECFGRVRRVPELEAKLKAYAARAKADAAKAKAYAAWAKIIYPRLREQEAALGGGEGEHHEPNPDYKAPNFTR